MAKSQYESGSMIDGFRLDERLHHGRGAEVWRVSRPDIEGAAVMKVPAIGGDRSRLVEFEVEQMILAELGGPHVPRVIAQGDFAVQPYIVMEDPGGPTLAALLAGGPLPLDQVVRSATSMTMAIADLHQQHVLHLDLEPSNIMFRPTGEAVLIDFGLSRHAHLPDLVDAKRHRAAGNLPYMAPEQLLRFRSDKRSDIFAIGALMFQMVTGVKPFGLPAHMKQVRRRVWRDADPPRKFQPEIEPALQEVILKCLEPVPAARYASAEDLAFDLRHLDLVELTERSGRAERSGKKATFGRWLRVRTTMHEIAAAATRPAPRPPVILVIVDLRDGLQLERHALLEAAANALANMPGARLACLNVSVTRTIAGATTGGAGEIDRPRLKAELRVWAEPLHLPRGSVTYSLGEARSVASAVLDFAKSHVVGHLVVGARALAPAEVAQLATRIGAGRQCLVTVVDVTDGVHVAAPTLHNELSPH